jgi:hypothetical protein
MAVKPMKIDHDTIFDRITIPENWKKDVEDWVESSKRKQKSMDMKYSKKLELLSNSMSKCFLFCYIYFSLSDKESLELSI